MKRQREPTFQYEVKDGYVVITYNGKRYAWFPPFQMIIDRFLSEDTYDYTVIHNNDGQAMLNVESLRNNKDVFRQEINPLEEKDNEEWVKDK